MMKRLLLLLLLCLFLSGCEAHGAKPETENPVSARTEEESPSLPDSLYDPDSPLEAETAGVLKVYPLPYMEPQGLWQTDAGLVLMGQADGCTLLQTLAGEACTVTGSLFLNTALSPEDGYLQFFGSRLAYYDPMTLQLVMLDEALRELERIPVPEDTEGTPLLSPDGKALYYCTRETIRVLETDTGISRVLKEISGQYQTAVSLHEGDRLQCALWEEDGKEKALILSTHTGKLLWQGEGSAELAIRDGNFWFRFSSGDRQMLVYGQEGGQPMTLIPADMGGDCRFLPRSNGALSRNEGMLDYYDLATGRRTASLTLPDPVNITSVTDGGGGILWLLGTENGAPSLFRWDTSLSLTGDSGGYAGSYSTQKIPDGESFDTCLQYAQTLSQRFGVEIRIFEEATRTRHPDCTMEAEKQPALVMRQLAMLEQQFAILPAVIPESLAAQYEGLRISLVRRITPEENALLPENPGGIQFWDGTTACITLSAAQTETTLLHELFHLMDTVAYTKTGSFDRWEELNPMQFSYTRSYQAPVPEAYASYLLPETRAFADEYSMTFPAEERARLFEYAVTPGNEALFQSHTMQKKLTAICTGIREIFELQKEPEAFPWEQYLKEPIA